MAQLVSDFIINPVLRQARRFSSGFAANEPPAIDGPALHRRRARSIGELTAAGSAILESEEHGTLVTGSPTLALSNSLETSNRNHRPPGPSAESPLPHPDVPPAALENFVIPESNRNPASEPDAQRDVLTTTATDAATPPWSVPEGNRSTPLPEDDGMGDLRRRIQAIQLLEVAQETKAQMMHRLLTEKYTRIQQSHSPKVPTMRPVSPASITALDPPEPPELSGPLQVLKKWNPLGDGSGPLNLPLTEEDLRPTYAPKRRPNDRDWWSVDEQPEEEELRLGCEHYRRNVKLQCASCERWYTCRHCHDAVEDHALPRRQTKHMLCMVCGCAQRASDTCTKCGQSAAYYYCGICKLWNDDPNKPIYHCSDCGLCRVGQGLGKDFFHCKKCMACISMSDMNNHKCVERAVDSDCPICNEYLFNSPKSVMFMQCGHSIHLACFEELKKTSYRCPLCNKSCVNMEYHFRQLDMHILQQPMPPDYADARAVISCNDCCAKSQTAFHWLGLKCAVCRSYNTVQLQLLNMPGDHHEDQAQQQQLSQQGAQQPVALDPALLTEEIRRRNRAARRQEARQRRDSNNNHTNNFQGFGLLSTSPSSYSPAFLLRLLNRSAPSESEPASSTPSSSLKKPRAASSLRPDLPNTLTTTETTAPEAACDSDEEDEEEDDGDMLDLFGARDRDFDRMTGLTSAESVVGFDDDEEEEEDEDEEESSDDEADADGDDEDEDDDDDILLVGHR